tara:strand:+ start:3266 stop:3490 length:225 start_codon:yes stop_codon:yes gene_type:complete
MTQTFTQCCQLFDASIQKICLRTHHVTVDFWLSFRAKHFTYLGQRESRYLAQGNQRQARQYVRFENPAQPIAPH